MRAPPEARQRPRPKGSRASRRSPSAPCAARSASGADQCAGEEVQPDASDRAAADAHRLQAGRPARKQPQRDAGEVQQPGRDHEADAVGERARGLGQLRAVGVAVEDRERADQRPPRPTAAGAARAPPWRRVPQPMPRCPSRRPGAARPARRRGRRTPSPKGTLPAKARSRVAREMRPTGRPRPSPPRDRSRRSGG